MSFRPSAHTSFSANDRNGLTRRTVLFGGLTAGALTLAGCAFNKDIRPTGSGDTFSGSPSALPRRLRRLRLLSLPRLRHPLRLRPRQAVTARRLFRLTSS